MDTEKIFTPKDLIKIYPSIGTEGHLANLRNQNRGPKYYELGKRKIIYRDSDVREWLFSSPVLTLESHPD